MSPYPPPQNNRALRTDKWKRLNHVQLMNFKGKSIKVVGNRRVMLPISLKIMYLYVLVARICYCNHGWYIYYNGFRDKTV